MCSLWLCAACSDDGGADDNSGGCEDGDPGPSCDAGDYGLPDAECPPDADRCYEGTGCGDGPYWCADFTTYCAQPAACTEGKAAVDSCAEGVDGCTIVPRTYCNEPDVYCH